MILNGFGMRMHCLDCFDQATVVYVNLHSQQLNKSKGYQCYPHKVIAVCINLIGIICEGKDM